MEKPKVDLRKILTRTIKTISFFLSIPTVLIIICASAICIIKIEDGSYNEEKEGNTGKEVRKEIHSSDINNTNNISGINMPNVISANYLASTQDVIVDNSITTTKIGIIVKDGENYRIDINLDEKVDRIIEVLREKDGPVFKYIKEDKLHKYLKAFIEAELVTQFPDLRSDFSSKLGDGEFQGCIEIHRPKKDSQNGETERLTYVDQSTFDTYRENYEKDGNEQILKHFTLDAEGNIEVAGWIKTTTNITSNVPEEPNVTDQIEYEITIKTIDYRPMIEKHTMPFDFLWAITVAGDDADFAYNLANLALKSKIIFTIQESFSTTVEEITEEYDMEKKEYISTRFDITGDAIGFETIPQQIINEKILNNYKIEKNIKTEDCTVTVDLTYANTWLAIYQNTASKIPVQSGPFENIETPEDTEYELKSELKDDNLPEEAKKDLQSELVYTLAEMATKNINDFEKSEDYFKVSAIDGSITGTIEKPIVYQEYQRKSNQKITTKTTASAEVVQLGTPTIEENIGKGPGERNFVTLYLKSESARNNISSIPIILYECLKSSDQTTDLLDITKYLLYIAENDERAEDVLSIQEYLFTLLQTYESGVGNLREYLLQFSQENVAVGAEKSEDGKYYKMYDDGQGWPTIGNADLQWKSHHTKFAVPGKILHKGEEKEVENVAEYVNTNCMTNGTDVKYTKEQIVAMDIYIELKLVNQVGDDLQQEYYDAVVANDLKGMDLLKQQIYPLIAIKYNFGILPKADDGRTFKEVYEDGINKEGHEERSWKHNMYVWDNWWCQLGGRAEGHIPARDAAFETYVKGVFDFSHSTAGKVFSRNYLFYTSEQLDKFSYAPRDKNGLYKVLRTAENEEETFTMVETCGVFRDTGTTEKYIHGYYTSTTGRTFTILWQGKIGYETSNGEFDDFKERNDDKDGPGWAGRCNRAASAIIASGYSGESPKELIKKINDNYDATIPTDKYWNQYGLTRTKFHSGHINGNETEKLIIEQLQKGGYLAVWVDVENGGTMIGNSSGKTLTTGIHWMAILDYKIENGRHKILIADYRGAWWADSNEFGQGINMYALIDEL